MWKLFVQGWPEKLVIGTVLAFVILPVIGAGAFIVLIDMGIKYQRKRTAEGLRIIFEQDVKDNEYLCITFNESISAIEEQINDKKYDFIKEKIKNCDRNYTDCCGRYKDGSWGLAKISPQKATCFLIPGREIVNYFSENICIKNYEFDKLKLKTNSLEETTIGR